VRALNATGEEAIDQTIAEVQAEITRLDGLCYSLKMMRRARSVYHNGRPAKAPRGSKKKTASNARPGPSAHAAMTDGPEVSTGDAVITRIQRASSCRRRSCLRNCSPGLICS
jgi:hypothetical protein